MVQATIHISDDTDHIINIVKARHKLKDKSAAIDFIVAQYGAEMLEPELKPEFIEKINKIKKEKSIRVDDFAKRYGLDV